MNEKERENLLKDILRVVNARSELDARNGFVRRGECAAVQGIFKRGIEDVAKAVEKVHDEVKEQSKITQKINTKLTQQIARQGALEEFEVSHTDIRRMRLTQWGTIAKWIGLILAILSTVVAATLFVSGKITNESKTVDAVKAALEEDRAFRRGDE